MRHLVFVRHGESELNAISRHTRTYCGQNETPLTDVGRAQARAAGQKLAALEYLRPAAAISSPLMRAVETLSLLLAQLSAAVNLLPPAVGLMERSHGKFEGLAEEDVFRDYPQYRDDPKFCHFMNHFEQCAPGGETLAIVTERAWLAVRELTEATSGDLIIVSHFNPIRCVVGRALEMTPAETLKLHIPNAQPIVLGFNGSFRLVEGPELVVPGIRVRKMAFSESLASRVRDALAHRKGVTEKKMFGGVGFLLHGNLLVGVWKDSLIVRLGALAREQALREPHVAEFDITGRAMKGWVLVEPEGMDEDRELAKWIDRAWAFVNTLPAK